MSNKLQSVIDRFCVASIIRIIPNWIKPNHLTVIRFFLIPVVLYLIALNLFIWSLIVFLIAASLDLLDGALARQRRQISSWGMLLDPAADKLLVVLTILFLAVYYIHPLIPLLMILADLMMIAASASMMVIFKITTPLAADWLGKMKMVFAVLSVLFLYLALLFGGPLIVIADSCMIVTVIFGFASFLVYGIKFVGIRFIK